MEKENKKLLIVVDMQNDFIDGSLGSPQAREIVPNVCKKIHSWTGDIITTHDTHDKNYLETREGKYLPVEHCIVGTEGHFLNKNVQCELKNSKKWIDRIIKHSFGYSYLDDMIRVKDLAKYDYIELVGLCTDICVVSNALIIKALLPEVDIAVDASCCAGVTPETHKAALLTMKSCQIDIKEDKE